MAHREFKNRLYQEFARIGKAIASPQRLEILDLLAQREWSVEELANETEQSIANTSAHLKVLRTAHLVTARRDGSYVFYRLADEHIFQLWRTIRSIGETQLAEIDRIVDEFTVGRDDETSIQAAELLEHLDRDDVTVIDVRPANEFVSGHLPGARSIPIDELHHRLEELDPERDVIAYCRGPYCLFADEAVALLCQHGYRAWRLADGLPDWKLAGYPVDRQHIRPSSE